MTLPSAAAVPGRQGSALMEGMALKPASLLKPVSLLKRMMPDIVSRMAKHSRTGSRQSIMMLRRRIRTANTARIRIRRKLILLRLGRPAQVHRSISRYLSRVLYSTACRAESSAAKKKLLKLADSPLTTRSIPGILKNSLK